MFSLCEQLTSSILKYYFSNDRTPGLVVSLHIEQPAEAALPFGSLITGMYFNNMLWQIYLQFALGYNL